MPLSSLRDGWHYLESYLGHDKRHLRTGREYRLHRMRLLAQALGNPQRHYTIFHVAGSKGKGSTATLLAHALGASGAVTGLFTSPHLCDYPERIQVLGFHLRDQLILEELRTIQAMLDHPPAGIGGEPTFFELITLLALLVFRRCGCRFVVLEVGLGGRLDATNIVVPAASIITPIELEHCAILGDNLASIAEEKAGIIKEGAPVFSARQDPVARNVIAETARQRDSPLFFLDELLAFSESQLAVREHGGLRLPTGQNFRLMWRDGREQQGRLTLIGQVQLANAALVLALLARLRPAGQASDWLRGLSQAPAFARSQFLPLGSSILCLDGAHTAQSIAAALSTFLPVSSGARRSLIFTTLPDKDCQAMVSQLAPHFTHITVTQLTSNFKQANCREIAEMFAHFGRQVHISTNPGEALEYARSADYILACGSFYLAGEILSLVASPSSTTSIGLTAQATSC